MASTRPLLDPAATSSSPPPDAVLVQYVRAGNAAVFEEIFRTHVDGLIAFACGYVDSTETAEDLVGDVFLSIWANRAAFSVTESLNAYLYAAVRNRALRSIDRARRAKAWTADALAGDRPPAVSTSRATAEAQVLTGEIAAATARALASLPERPRQVYLLYRQHDLSYSEIGAALGISARTVEGHMARAIATLRGHLADFL